MDTALTVAFTLLAVFAACGATWFISRRAFGRRSMQSRIITHHITERIASVGRLVGLEVCAKEIATATSGWAWLPPILLSQARLAMIFHFRKQYWVDLSRLTPDDVTEIGPGWSTSGSTSRVRLRLPPVEGALSLTEMTPYDIQSGRVIGLLDVIPMNARRQRELMQRAQEQAAALYESNDHRYLIEARAGIERHVRSLLQMCGVDAEIEWADAPASAHDDDMVPPPSKFDTRVYSEVAVQPRTPRLLARVG